MQKKLQQKEEILDENGDRLALIVNTNLTDLKKEFHTKNDENFQVGTFNLSEGESLDRHVHLENTRNINSTSEALIILEGELEVEIFDSFKNFINTRVLTKGYLILFLKGGHSFKVNQDCKFIEVKQGPYSEGLDKEKF